MFDRAPALVTAKLSLRFVERFVFEKRCIALVSTTSNKSDDDNNNNNSSPRSNLPRTTLAGVGKGCISLVGVVRTWAGEGHTG